MKTMTTLSIALILTALLAHPATTRAEDLMPIKLPVPHMAGGKPLMQALKERSSMREFSSRDLPLQVLSDMLWASCGINRPDSGLRTAPTARNMQEIDVYVARADGLYLYYAKNNMLMPIVAGDMRELTGKQPFVKSAPINLIFVADLAKMGGASADAVDLYSATDTGFVSQNVYLYCASAGLSTVVRGMIDRSAMARAMKLRSDQRIILAQTVGYPKE